MKPIEVTMNAISNIHVFPGTAGYSRSLCAEIEALHSLVRAACPPSAVISICFDGHFNLFVDVRSLEEAATVEAILPDLAGGAFSDLRRSGTPHQPFRHRVTATITA